jgi:hypothetical protein
MSQYTIRPTNTVTVQYGFDRIIGYFLTVFDSTQETEDNDQGITREEDRFTGFKGADLGSVLMSEYGMPATHPHVVASMLDLPF